MKAWPLIASPCRAAHLAPAVSRTLLPSPHKNKKKAGGVASGGVQKHKGKGGAPARRAAAKAVAA